MKVLEKVKRSVLITGNNYCKQVGIRSASKIDVKEFERIWKKYTEDSNCAFRADKVLDKRQAKRFLKHFSSALGEDFDEIRAEKLFLECDEFRTQTLNYDQFKKLFWRFSLVNEGKAHLTENLKNKLCFRAPIFAGKSGNFSDGSSISSLDEEEESSIASSQNNYSSHKGKEEEDWKDDIIFDSENHSNMNDLECFELIQKERVKPWIDQQLFSVSSVLGLLPSEVALLMRLFDWDKEKLLCSYFDDPERWKSEAGILPKEIPKISDGKLEEINEESRTDEFDCPVCYDTVSYSETFALDNCGHRFCKTCWQMHLRTIVESFGTQMLHKSKCMQSGCSVLIHSDHFEKLGDEFSVERFRYFFAKGFVENNKRANFCPFDCGSVAHRIDRPSREDEGRRPSEDVVNCLCKKSYCFECLLEAHQPVNCSQMKNWMERNEADKDSLHLITSISKPCPECGIATDRIDGCNHMVCPQCSHEWCWQCREGWWRHGDRTGGFYHCNMYEKREDIVKKDEEAEQMREDHNRFLHHFNGFHVNEKDENGIRELKPKIMEAAINYKELTGGDPSFLSDALDTLISARHLLKQSYVYAFFLPAGETSQKEIFEMQQAHAQNITERLAKEVMEPVEIMDRNRIVFLHKACKQFLRNLIEFFESKEGIELYSMQTKEKKMKGKEKKKEQTNWWICETCTFGNPNVNSVCELCGKSRRLNGL